MAARHRVLTALCSFGATLWFHAPALLADGDVPATESLSRQPAAVLADAKRTKKGPRAKSPSSEGGGEVAREKRGPSQHQLSVGYHYIVRPRNTLMLLAMDAYKITALSSYGFDARYQFSRSPTDQVPLHFGVGVLYGQHTGKYEYAAGAIEARLRSLLAALSLRIAYRLSATVSLIGGVDYYHPLISEFAITAPTGKTTVDQQSTFEVALHSMDLGGQWRVGETMSIDLSYYTTPILFAFSAQGRGFTSIKLGLNYDL